MGKAGDERCAVVLLELVEFRAVDNARDDFANVVRLARVLGHDTVDLFSRMKRVNWFLEIEAYRLRPIQVSDDAPDDGQRMRIVFSEMVSDP